MIAIDCLVNLSPSFPEIAFKLCIGELLRFVTYDDVYLGLALCIYYSEIVKDGVHKSTTEIHYLNTVVICFKLSITLTH